ncbi:unnamed protein product [Rotaria socialis]|uniref:Uncharacterized protein n=2 Tax=Rotaria socialis TaxID=392032 RepID=A0A818D4S2_9BILA|nr:unnamed protein product [Rotaria socialis]CAF3437796.1 unnamed protein product [Rotaria socialis]CAF4773987.1 unnamed protein product [Rotaria socialis]
MPPKAGQKKSAKSEEDPKKKDTLKNAKKGADESNAAGLGNTDLGSISNENVTSSKTGAGNLTRGASHSGTPLDDHSNKEPGVSTSELSQHTDGNRESGETGLNTGGSINGAALSEADVKYEEPILPNLIVLGYEGGKEKGLFEGYGKATYVGGHSYTGDWSGGMMNGQGRYEWADGVVYSGTIVNNQIDGVGTYQWPDGSVYQGDVYRGRRHGTGIFRHGKSLLTYEGEWRMGHIHGKGTLQFGREGQNYYTGDFIMNIPFGKGRRQYASGNLYEGMWVNGKRHGYGVFSWSNGNGEYLGQWENGVQNGHGVHIWYIIRAEESQYALRNYYEGNFLDGRRNGYGTFYYSSGTKYIGEWKADQKHGKGKVILRNGTMIEADFQNDRIITPLTNDMTSMLTIELPEIVSKTPIPSASNTLDPMNLRRSESRNTISPNFKLQFNGAFHHMSTNEDDRMKISDQMFHVLFRHLPQLKQIYRIYARLGVDLQTNIDNTFLMTRIQFWRFVLDCNLHSYGVTTTEYDRLIAECLPTENMHGPDESILVREFLNAIAIICFHLHRLKKVQSETASSEKQPISLQIATSMETIIEKNILQLAGNIRGNLFAEPLKFIQAARYKEQCYKIYLVFSTRNKKEPHDMIMQKRDFLLMLKRLQLIDPVHLTASRIIAMLAEDDPNIRPLGSTTPTDIRLDIDMCFLEFFEALIACALVHPGSKYYNTYVKPPKTATSERSLGSQPSIGSPSAHDRQQESRVSEYPAIVVREVSELTQETPDDIDKPRSSASRERETNTNAGDASSSSSFVAKLDDFFNGIFLPATNTFENIREQIRVDQEKTWQGMKHDDHNSDATWPKQYVVLTE